MVGELQVHGENHLIWDAIIEEENKFRPYPDYILHKEGVIYSSKKVVTLVREKINKKPIEYANNAIDFLSCLSESGLKECNINDRVPIMTWERKVMNKNHHVETFQAKVNVLAHQME